MLEVPVGDDKLETLLGMDLSSDVQAGVRYRLLRSVGAGGSAAAFLAMRVALEGSCPVVIKLLRPSVVRILGERAALVVAKESVALQRLNDQVPSTPFVVRFIDSGALKVDRGGKPMDLPWVVVEYVHGGPEGTTLTSRVAHSLRTKRCAFEPARAAIAVEHISRGLHAVHEVGVIHRDLKPDNVLVCGSGDEEIFKIADFGVARAQGGAATFGAAVGTPGYSGPELSSLDPAAVGPWSDVLGLACVFFFLLTGEAYFPFTTAIEAQALVRKSERRSILAAPALSPELREQPDACRAIDLALARATAAVYTERTQSAVGLCAEVLPHLRPDSRRSRPVTLRVRKAEALRGSYTFSVVHRPVDGLTVRDVAWNGDGRALAVTSRGLSFWDGTTWRGASLAGFPEGSQLRFVARTGPGAWIVGGDSGTFARYTSAGAHDVVRGDPATRFDRFAGDLDDLAVLVGSARGGPQTLFALIGRRWAKPLPVPEVSELRAVCRVEDTKWLLAGKDTVGEAYVAIYNPIDREVERLPAPPVASFYAAAGRVEEAMGAAAGAQGAFVRWEAGKTTVERVARGHDLRSVAFDPSSDRIWVGGAGKLWLRRADADEGRAQPGGAKPAAWSLEWEDAGLQAPLLSILSDASVVRAISVEGAVIEGSAG